MAAETLKRLWEDLQKGRSDGAKVLSEINTLLVSSVSDVKEIVPELPLAPLFGNLNCDNVELVRVTSSVLEKLLDLMPLELVCQLSTYVEVGLQHSEHSVIELSVRQLKRYCSSAESRSLVLAPTMLHLIMQMLDSENLDLSKSAHDLILLISRGDRRSLLVDRKEVFASDLRLLLEKNSTVRFRVYELLIDIGAQSDDALSEVLDLRILQTLLTELESSDVLVQLNCLEMMSQLLTTARGFEYVQSSGVIEQVYKVLVTARNDPFIIIIPGTVGHRGGTLYSPHRGGTLYSPHRGGTLYSPHRGGTLYSPHRGGTLYSPHRGGTLYSPHRGGTLNSPHRGDTLYSPHRGGTYTVHIEGVPYTVHIEGVP